MKTFHPNCSYSFYGISVYLDIHHLAKYKNSGAAKWDLFKLAPSYSDTDR